MCALWAHENGKWLKLGDRGRAECPWARLANADETPWEWLWPQGLQIGLRGVWPQLVVPATAGGNLCFDSMAELIRGRTCLQTLLWTLDCCFVPTQQLLQRRLFQSALTGKNSICLRAVGEVPLRVSPATASRQGLSWSPAIAPLEGVSGQKVGACNFRV